MAFPGTCCSRLHRINGGRREFWKQSCSSLGQTPAREAPWGWITSKTHRDKSTKSLKTRILHSSPVYDIWRNHCSAQKLCGDSDPSSWGLGWVRRGVSSSDISPMSCILVGKDLRNDHQRKRGLNGDCGDGTEIPWVDIWCCNSISTSFKLLFHPLHSVGWFMTLIYPLQTATRTNIYWGIWMSWLQCGREDSSTVFAGKWTALSSRVVGLEPISMGYTSTWTT